jgi:DHA1 family multidrug resistance protein-like MFS transporter
MPDGFPDPDPATSKHRNDWRALLVLFLLAGIVESQAFGHLGAFTPLFLQELRVPVEQVPTWTGILAALGFVIGLPLLPFWGVWADRFGRKIIIVRTAYVEALLFSVTALSPNVWALAAGRLLTGFVLGNTGVMLALLADVTPRRRLGLAVGIASAAFPLGSAIGPYFGGLIVQGPGIRALLLLDAALSGAVGLVLTLAVREEPRVMAAAGSVIATLRAAVRDVLAARRVVRLFVVYFLATFAMSLVGPFVPILLQQLYHGTLALLPSMIGVTLTAAGIAMAITTPLWGRLGDLIGRWRVLPISLLALLAGLALEAVVPALAPLRLAIFGVGLFQGAVGTTIIALLALLAPPERRASILNFSLLPAQLSWFLAPITGAGLVALAQSLPVVAPLATRVPFVAGAAAMFGATLLAVRLTLREARGAQPTRPTSGLDQRTETPDTPVEAGTSPLR